MTAPMFDRVALIGLGLIGSSLALAMRRKGLAGRISGHARSARTRAAALDIGFVDEVHETPENAAKDADLVVLCTPLGAYGAVMEAMRGSLKTGAIVSDVGSVKKAVVDVLTPLVPDGVHLVPAHPIAGTEQSGPHAGFAELFEGRWCVITPVAGVARDATARIEALWRACGCDVERMTPTHHDRVLAITSHIPHLIAYNIVGTAADVEEVSDQEVMKYAAGGFRDFTRIAASDPTMWRDVFLNNREAVLEMLGRFTEDLSALQRAIRWSDGDALYALFERTRAIRRGVVEAGQDTAQPDFGRDAHRKSGSTPDTD